MGEIKILRGEAAYRQLNSSEFQHQWQALHDACPWSTVCQSVPFVVAWYRIYQAKYSPVIVYAGSRSGELSGIFTLAISRDGARLIVAGNREAEYHCWLEAPNSNGEFIRDAVREISSTFPGRDLLLKYIPPGVPIDPFLDRARFGARCAIRPHRRPLLRTDQESIEQQLRKKSIKRKINSLKRCGSVEFDRIFDNEQFAEIFDQICVQCDRRQKKVHEVTPFASDPLRKQFYLELHKLGLLHATVLRVNGKVIASHAGVICKGSVQLNLITHATEFDEHSPGAVHIAMLGAQLMKEQIGVFDLTPGGDEYKERFANDHDMVFELTLYRSSYAYYRNEAAFRIKEVIKRMLGRFGIEPIQIRRVVRRLERIGMSNSGVARGTAGAELEMRPDERGNRLRSFQAKHDERVG